MIRLLIFISRFSSPVGPLLCRSALRARYLDRQAGLQQDLAAVIARIPVGKLGSAQYIADAAVLLSADNAYFATGACWDVNGGLFMR